MDDAPPPAEPPGAPADAPADRDAMPRWVPRAIVLAVGVLAAYNVGGWLLSRLRSLLIMLLVSLFLSFAIEPAVNWLAARGWRRGPATGVVFLVLLLAVAGFVGAIGTLVANQVQGFVDQAPDYINDLETFVNDNFDANFEFDDLVSEFTDPDGSARQFANDIAGNVIGFGVTALAVLFQLFAILLFTFYIVADGPRLRRTILSRLPPRRQRVVLRAWDLAIDKTGGYLYSRTLLAFISAVAHWIALSIIGVPFPVALALWVGVVSQFVPTVGTYLAGALAVLVAALNDPVHGLWTLAFIVVYQQVENYLLAPRVTAHTMEIHPAVAFGAVIAGAGILGPVGALLALPAAAIIQAFLSTLGERHEVIDPSLTTDPEAPGREPDPDGDRDVDPDG